MLKQVLVASFVLTVGTAWAQEMKVEFAGLPAESDYVTLAFRDIDGPGQMSMNGGHGKLGFAIKAGSAEVNLPPVQQGKNKALAETKLLIGNW